MGLFSWGARVFGLRRSDPPPETSRERVYFFGQQVAGVRMTHDDALRLSAVWACVTVISKAIASCPWEAFTEDDAGNRMYRRSSRVWGLLNIRPNPEMTPFAFREAALIQSLLWGNFYAEIERDVAGRPVAIWPISAERCCLERFPNGRLMVRIDNHDGGIIYLEYKDVFHIHGPSIDGLEGFDAVVLAARSLAHAAAAETFGSAFYGNGTQMGGVLTAPHNLSPEAKAELRESLNARHQGPENAFKFMLAEGGMQYEKLTVDPETAQFIETRQFLVEEVCRWFGVPPHKVQHLLRATFNNIEHLGIEFVRDALIPWCERLRQEADWKLVPGSMRGMRTRIDTDWLAEGDAKSKAETDAQLVQNGLLTRNEARRRRGLNTHPDADDLTVQVNMTTLDKIGVDNLEDEGTRDMAFALTKILSTRRAEMPKEAGDEDS